MVGTVGLRTLPPSPWVRVRSGWKAGLAAATAVIGGVRTVLTFTGAANVRFTLGELAITLPAFISVGLVAAYLRGRTKMLPDSFVDEMGSERSYRAEYCTGAALREACDLTKDCYGQEYVSHDVAEQWRVKNLQAFVQIRDPAKGLCAAFGVLALSDSFMEQFIRGTVTDHQLGADDVLAPDESRRCTRLYLSGVVVRDAGSFLASKRARVMCWTILEYIRQLYGLSGQRDLYAIAVTKESSRLMANLGFSVEASAGGRKDQCDLYRFRLTEASWKELLCRVYDCSVVCSCEFAMPQTSGAQASRALSGERDQNILLFVAGDRGGTQRNQIQIPREFASIDEALRASQFREAFALASPILAATRQTIVEAYKHRPVIIHFAGHGDQRSLSFILDQGVVVTETQVFADQLSAILRHFPRPVRLCVLNTCNSASIAQHLVDAGVVEAAIGWPGTLADATAIAFSRAFYGCIGDGLTLSQAIGLAAESSGIGDAPLLFQAGNASVNFANVSPESR
jgi:CHAT domain-containing protein